MREAAEGFRMKTPFVTARPFSLRLGENGRIVPNGKNHMPDTTCLLL